MADSPHHPCNWALAIIAVVVLNSSVDALPIVIGGVSWSPSTRTFQLVHGLRRPPEHMPEQRHLRCRHPWDCLLALPASTLSPAGHCARMSGTSWVTG